MAEKLKVTQLSAWKSAQVFHDLRTYCSENTIPLMFNDDAVKFIDLMQTFDTHPRSKRDSGKEGWI